MVRWVKQRNPFLGGKEKKITSRFHHTCVLDKNADFLDFACGVLEAWIETVEGWPELHTFFDVGGKPTFFFFLLLQNVERAYKVERLYHEKIVCQLKNTETADIEQMLYVIRSCHHRKGEIVLQFYQSFLFFQYWVFKEIITDLGQKLLVKKNPK